MSDSRTRLTRALLVAALTAGLVTACGEEPDPAPTPAEQADHLCLDYNGATPLFGASPAKTDLTPAEADRLVERATAFAEDNPEWSGWADGYNAWVRAAEPLSSADYDTLMNTGTAMAAPYGLETEHAIHATFRDRVCPIGGEPAP